MSCSPSCTPRTRSKASATATRREIAALLAGCDEPESAVDDPGPEPPPENPTSRLGDLWILGDHRLLCGDSTQAADVARLMAGEQAVLLATDPPY